MDDAQFEEIHARATLVRDSINGFLEALEEVMLPRVEVNLVQPGWEIHRGGRWLEVVRSEPVTAADDESDCPYYWALEFEEPYGGQVYPVKTPVVARPKS